MNFDEWFLLAMLLTWLMGLLLMFIMLIDLAMEIYIRIKRELNKVK